MLNDLPLMSWLLLSILQFLLFSHVHSQLSCIFYAWSCFHGGVSHKVEFSFGFGRHKKSLHASLFKFSQMPLLGK